MRTAHSVVLAALAAGCASAKSSPTPTLAARYTVVPNLVYLRVGDWEGRLDLYLPEPRGPATPTLVWIHGGGWTRSCAVAWVHREAPQHGLGTATVVVSGISAGGHLALETAFVDAELPATCPGSRTPPPTAVVSWFGPTDVEAAIAGPHTIDQVLPWFDGVVDPAATARAVSPIHQVRPGLPPVLLLHGTRDDLVPYAHSVALHDALDRVDVPNRLVTLDGGHGDFDDATWVRAWDEVWQFLDSLPAR